MEILPPLELSHREMVYFFYLEVSLITTVVMVLIQMRILSANGPFHVDASHSVFLHFLQNFAESRIGVHLPTSALHRSMSISDSKVGICQEKVVESYLSPARSQRS